jgi:hypothetical protein
MKVITINASRNGDKGHTRTGAVCAVVTLAKRFINRCQSCGRFFMT